MNYETNLETSLRKTDLLTFYIGKEIEPEESPVSKTSEKPRRKQQIVNKKEVVHKLIKYFKDA
ncbi:MAG TPA: hypothetical protein VK856_09135 [Anaerolineaceae bacterium]|nr:hypothetical protein [Anaerolineaceae bacterium]